MHLSYFKRPLFIFLVLYIAFIAARKDRLLDKSDNLSLFIPAEKAEITAVVSEFPRRYGENTSLFLKVLSINGIPCKGKAVAYINELIHLRWRSKVKIKGNISPVQTAGIIGNLSGREYYFSKGIQTEIDINEIKEIQKPGFPAGTVNKLREHTLHTFESNFSAEQSAILAGITLGETTSLSQPLHKAFRDSGAMHLLVASGANVGFVTCIIYLLTSWFGINRKRSALTALVAAGLYTLCAGADPPLLRAYVMTVFATFGFILQRESGIFQGLIISCLIILIIAPVTLFYAGFQMSFLATLGILLAVSNYKVPAKLPFWVKFVLVTFVVSAGATLAIYPVLALCFNRVSLISVFANIFLVPFSGVLMTLGFIISFTALLPFAKLSLLFVYPSKFMLWLFLFLVKFFAGFPFSAVKIASFKWPVTAAYYLIAFAIFYLPNKYVRKRFSCIFTSAAVLLLVINFTFFRKGRIYLFSTKYSRSILIETRNYKTILVDAGINGKVLAKAVMAAGSLTLDSVFLSGLNYSSFSGLSELSDLIKIKKIYIPYGGLKPKLKKDLPYLESKGIKIIRLWEGDGFSGSKWQGKTLWGLFVSKGIKFWRLAGYSGFADMDNLSYKFTLPEISFETGANSYFVNILKHSQMHNDKFNIISGKGYTTMISYTRNSLNVSKI